LNTYRHQSLLTHDVNTLVCDLVCSLTLGTSLENFWDDISPKSCM